MSNARWCDWGDHPFSNKVGYVMMGRQPSESEQKQNPYGQPAQPEVNEMCNQCAAEAGLIEDYQAPLSPKERREAMLGMAPTKAITNGDPK